MIREFQNEHRFLSNFYGAEEGHVQFVIVFEGLSFVTVEHAYMAAKHLDPELRLAVQALATPGRAKRFAAEHGLAVREDWHDVKLGIMEDLIRQKFRHPVLRDMLLATGDEHLQEGNTWNDVFWGVDLATGEGENHLGRILMKIRAELRP